MASIGFYGGVGSVTGANFLLDTGFQKILIDCGLVQGGKFVQEDNARAFPYDPRDIAILFVTHAHADHIGRIPKLVKDGFSGVIISTPPTKDLSTVMLQDAYEVMKSEATAHGVGTLYEREHVDAALRLWKTLPYHSPYACEGEVSVEFTNAGHILGSAFVTFTRRGKKVFFSGDIGNVPQPLLDQPEYPSDASFVVMESVYGDRLHEDVKNRSALLQSFIERTIRTKGTLIIPAFSLERTQAMLLEINNLFESGTLAPIPVFLDSPLAISVTEIYRTYTEYLKKEVREQIASGDDIFSFPRLSFTKTVSESREIDSTPAPKIIIAGSGMSHGGRIRRHERAYLDDPRTTVVLVGYQTVGSVGRLLQDGARTVMIDGESVKVKSHIETIHGYSGHADRDQLLDLVAHTAPTLARVYVAMGEEKSSLFLVQRIRDYLSVHAEAPALDSVQEIDW